MPAAVALKITATSRKVILVNVTHTVWECITSLITTMDAVSLMKLYVRTIAADTNIHFVVFFCLIKNTISKYFANKIYI